MATYVGFVTGMQDAGLLTAILGAVTATIGLITPSLIIILIVAAVLKSFRNNPYVERAFYGLRPASTGLIAAAGISVIASNLITIGGLEEHIFGLNWKGLALAVVLWLLTNKVKKTKKWHPIVFIGISAVVGILFQFK
jgi:chromate transporter